MGSSGSKLPPPNPSVSGHVSTSSTSSSASELESDSDEDDDATDNIINICNNHSDETEESSCSNGSPFRTLDTLLSNTEQKYGLLIKTPQQKDLQLYSNYVNIGLNAGEISDRETSPLKTSKLTVNNRKYSDTSFCVKPPKVSQKSLNIYREYLKRGEAGAQKVSQKSLDLYKQYINNLEKSRQSITIN
jgi:hypothetical protein